MSEFEVSPTPSDDMSAIKQLFVRGYTSAIQGYLILKSLNGKTVFFSENSRVTFQRVIYLTQGPDDDIEEIEIDFVGRNGGGIDWKEVGEEMNKFLKDIARVKFLGFGPEKTLVYKVSMNKDWSLN
jgi:hypothetical protein